MALFPLKDLLDGTRKLSVQLTGRNHKYTKNVLTTTPLAAGASFTSGWFDLTTVDKGAFWGLMVYADTLTEIAIQGDPGSDVTPPYPTPYLISVRYAPGTNERSLFLPFLNLPIGRYRIRVYNPTSVNQTYLYVAELYRPGEWCTPTIIKHWAIKDLAIRDTSNHTAFTDPSYMSNMTNYIGLPLKNVSIFIRNLLNQQVTIKVTVASPPLDATLGTKNVAAGQSTLITASDFPALNSSWNAIRLDIQCSTAPTTGTVDALVLAQF